MKWLVPMYNVHDAQKLNVNIGYYYYKGGGKEDKSSRESSVSPEPEDPEVLIQFIVM